MSAWLIASQFERQARDNVGSLAWVRSVEVTMTAQPPKPLQAEEVPRGLQKVSNIIAVSSCKVCFGHTYGAIVLPALLSLSSWNPAHCPLLLPARPCCCWFHPGALCILGLGDAPRLAGL